MEYLTVSEYAKFKGCSERYIRKLISDEKLIAEERTEVARGGLSGISYMIPLAACEPKVQKKYINRQRKLNPPPPEPKSKLQAVTLEEMSQEERQEVAKWKNILDEWKEYREKGGPKKERDEEFVDYISKKYPEFHFSVRILQRQAQALREKGEAALIDRRGKHKNHHRAIPPEVFDIFSSYYLDESQKTVAKCMRMTETWIRHEGKEAEYLPLAASNTFTREIMRSIPPAVVVYCRQGEKALKDKMLPFIRRKYDEADFYSNDIWVCDNHTFDVFVNDGEHKKPVRVYLTAFQDVRSRKFMGWYVTMNPCSDATLIALRRGIEKYGIPKQILSDNGREFLTFDIGGRGFRKAAATTEHEAPTILDNLGIEFRTAMVRNARAKIIERAFRDVKEDFSRMFEGYTGGTIMERPERLKKTGKDAENFTMLPEFVQFVDKYIEGIFNKHKHNGVGMRERNPDQVYADCLVEKRVATTDQLNLMMLRNTRMQKVGREGVFLKLHGQKIPYNSQELNFYHFGEKVYLRYDPDNLQEVRVYDEQDRFLCTAAQVASLSYFAKKEEVAAAMKEQRKYERTVKEWKEQNVKQAQNELELLMWEAEQNQEEGGEQPNAKIIELKQAQEKRLAQAVGGGQAESIDYTDAVRRLREAKEG